MTDARDETETVKKAARWLKKEIAKRKPSVAVITGSGLGDSVPPLENAVSFFYGMIPGFLKTTVAGHSGELVFGKFRGVETAVMRGRFHYYEGMEMNRIAVPVRTLYLLGVRSLVVTAAVGSLKKEIKPGDFVVLKDHINFTGANPLIGNYSREFGEMFPDMNEPYDRKLSFRVLRLARKLSFRARSGIYIFVSGPSYETPAEVKVYRKLGADVAGMSVVPEVITARQLKMRVLGISWVSNFASGISGKTLSHEEVLELGEKVTPKIRRLIEEALKAVDEKGTIS